METKSTDSTRGPTERARRMRSLLPPAGVSIPRRRRPSRHVGFTKGREQQTRGRGSCWWTGPGGGQQPDLHPAVNVSKAEGSNRPGVPVSQRDVRGLSALQRSRWDACRVEPVPLRSGFVSSERGALQTRDYFQTAAETLLWHGRRHDAPILFLLKTVS